MDFLICLSVHNLKQLLFIEVVIEVEQIFVRFVQELLLACVELLTSLAQQVHGIVELQFHEALNFWVSTPLLMYVIDLFMLGMNFLSFSYVLSNFRQSSIQTLRKLQTFLIGMPPILLQAIASVLFRLYMDYGRLGGFDLSVIFCRPFLFDLDAVEQTYSIYDREDNVVCEGKHLSACLFKSVQNIIHILVEKQGR